MISLGLDSGSSMTKAVLLEDTKIIDTKMIPTSISPRKSLEALYREIKKQHKDEILFYRIGDFYEMFFDDALTVSRELDLTLTGKQCGLEERAPMCGVPFHSYEGYVARLISKGYKVAICEQMEDPAKAKGLVKRDIIRVEGRGPPAMRETTASSV